MIPPVSKRQKKDILAAAINFSPYAPTIVMHTPPEKASQEALVQTKDATTTRNAIEVSKN